MAIVLFYIIVLFLNIIPGARDVDPRMFPDDLRPERCGVRAYLKFQSKKPPAAKGSDYKFFLNCKNQVKKDWKEVPFWYSTQHMGKENIGSLVSGQIKSIGVDTKAEKISSTSVRYI